MRQGLGYNCLAFLKIVSCHLTENYFQAVYLSNVKNVSINSKTIGPVHLNACSALYFYPLNKKMKPIQLKTASKKIVICCYLSTARILDINMEYV